eukprot:TRINITY_DN22855_c0_g1_i1.p2 TRINITY_DN22855_c0_g1~~TRINITY_DN22855_c0_g1_i1.p2  ORF type:complete len:126 (+),score=9.44 TRINITY_DN22855_c0_g1_i1:269-646(+)
MIVLGLALKQAPERKRKHCNTWPIRATEPWVRWAQVAKQKGFACVLQTKASATRRIPIGRPKAQEKKKGSQAVGAQSRCQNKTGSTLSWQRIREEETPKRGARNREAKDKEKQKRGLVGEVGFAA